MYSKKELTTLFERQNYKPTSVRSYVNTLSTVSRKFGFDGEIPQIQVEKWFDYETFKEFTEDLKTTTIRNYISAIIALMKARDEEKSKLYTTLSEIRDNAHNPYEERVKAGIMSDREKELWTSPSKLKNLYEKKIRPFIERCGFLSSTPTKMVSSDYDKNEINKIRKFVVLAFYFYPFTVDDGDDNFGIMRNDLPTLRLWKGPIKKIPKDYNFIHIPSRGNIGKIYMREYKTQKTHGEIVITLPKELTTILKNWVKFMNLDNEFYLFPRLTRHQITTILQAFTLKELGNSISTQMLRKMYITHRFGDRHKAMKETANNMMHSVDVQQSVYSKKI